VRFAVESEQGFKLILLRFIPILEYFFIRLIRENCRLGVFIALLVSWETL
jgi:hypothetical protein